MSVFVKCPACTTTLRTLPAQLGRRARCTKCGLVFRLASPIGQRIEDDEPETPQVIEEPPAQQQPVPQPEPIPLPDDEPPMAEEVPAEPERPARQKPPAERKPRAEDRPRKRKPQPAAPQSWGLLAAVAAVVFAVTAVGGVALYRHLSAPDKPKAEEPEVAAADTQKNAPPKADPKQPPTGKKDPTDAKPPFVFKPPVEVKDPPKVDPKDPPVEPKKNPPDPQPAPVKFGEPTTVRLDGAVSAVYPAAGGKYLLFHIPTLNQLATYDVAQGKVVGTISNLDQNSQIAVGREKAFIGRWGDGRIVRFDLRTGAQEALAVPQGQEQLNHLAVGSGSDGPLVSVVTGADKRYQARLLDPVTLNPLDVPIEDAARPERRSFPFVLPVGPSHVAVSADGRAVCLSDRLYTRTATGYSAVQINPSSALRPSPDGKVALGNSLWGEDGKVIRFEDREVRWFLPAADGPFWLTVEYARGAGKNARVLLHADKDTKPLGELPGADELTDWLGRNNVGLTTLHRSLAFLPNPGLVVLVPGGSKEVKFFPVDLPALLAKGGRDVVFTSVPPVSAPKGRPYSHTATAAAAGGKKVTFALEAGPQGMTVTPDGKLAWTPDAAFADPTADVKLVAKTADGKQAVQQFRLFLTTPKPGTPVAVLPKKDPIDPKKDPVIPKKDPVDPKKDPAVPVAGAAKTVDLGGAASSVAVGGAGRFVFLYLPAQRQIAVFDVTQGKVARNLPAPGNKALIAAGAEKLFVVSPDEGVVQRWDLKTFEKEVTAALPEKGAVKAALVGSASNGPLWLVGGDRFGGALTALDTKTLRTIELKPEKEGGRGALHGIGEGVRVSADGRTIGTWRFGTSPSGLTVLTLGDKTLKGHYEHDSVGHVTPSHDGRIVHTAIGRFTPEGKSLGDRDGEPGHGAKGTSYSFPAAEGASLYLNITFGRAAGGPPRPGAKGNGTLAVHWAADGKKLADLTDVAVGEVNVWDREAIGNDQRFMLVPSAKTLVVLPPTNDKLLLYPFDLDAVLDKSGKDYLLVEAPPAGGAVRGEQFTQNLFIKSKKGGVKAKVDSGPDGLTVTPDGKIAWAVPKDFADDEAVVIVTVSDASGQEVVQSLRLEVRGEKGAPVAVVPKKDPADPKKDPVVQPKDPPKDPPARKDEVVTVKLPGLAKAAVVGAGGKYLILLLPQQKQIAIVDVAAGKVAKYLPAAEEGALLAAGQDHLMVGNPTARVIQRYNLKTFEKEATVQQPIDGTMAALAMGSASKGPLLISATGDQWGGKTVLVDPVKMKVIPEGDKLPVSAAPFVRASADGRMFGWRNHTGSEGHDMTLVEIVDGKPKSRTFGAGTSLLLPSPDGRHVFCGEGVFNSQFKKLHPTNENNRFDRPFLPAVSGNLFMQLEPGGTGRFPGDPGAQPGPGKVNFFLPGQYRPFASIDKVEGLAGESYGYGGVPDVMMHDKRIHLFPEAGRLASIPHTNDKVVLHPFNLDDLLAKSGADYLLVTSDPPAEAVRGAEFTYKPAVKSKKGGVKVKLDAGPDGMKFAAGELVWKVPENFADKEVDVILTISDATGQEMFQTFKLTIRDK